MRHTIRTQDRRTRVSERTFPSFFMGGFECSTHKLSAGKRLDLITSTQHDRFVREDYERLVEQGMRVHGVTFPDERFIDIGTPESLIHALKTRLGHHFDPS